MGLQLWGEKVLIDAISRGVAFVAVSFAFLFLSWPYALTLTKSLLLTVPMLSLDDGNTRLPLTVLH